MDTQLPYWCRTLENEEYRFAEWSALNPQSYIICICIYIGLVWVYKRSCVTSHIFRVQAARLGCLATIPWPFW